MAQSTTIQEFREKISETILTSDFAQLFLLADNAKEVSSAEEWLYLMKQEGEWCDDIFVHLAATLLKKEIVLIPIYAHDGHGGSGKIIVTPEEKIGEPLFMLYYKDVHFQSILQVDSDANYTSI